MLVLLKCRVALQLKRSVLASVLQCFRPQAQTITFDNNLWHNTLSGKLSNNTFETTLLLEMRYQGLTQNSFVLTIIWMDFLGVRFTVVLRQNYLSPYLKLLRITLETWNLVFKVQFFYRGLDQKSGNWKYSCLSFIIYLEARAS